MNSIKRAEKKPKRLCSLLFLEGGVQKVTKKAIKNQMENVFKKHKHTHRVRKTKMEK